MDERAFRSLVEFMKRIPAIRHPMATGANNGLWWVKFYVDISHELAWHVIQELGHIINYLSLDERLPARFYPVSPPPYMNGGPKDFLSWIIENEDKEFKPGTLKKWLEGRLPNPVDNPEEWKL